MSEFEAYLDTELAILRNNSLIREFRDVDSAQGTTIRIGEQDYLNFSSNDYLGLADHPALKEAACAAIEEFGAGAGSARLICGNQRIHTELEEALAAFKGVEAALVFSTGYAAALGTISALLTKSDILIVDKLVHACIVDAARLTGCRLRVFRHNDISDLESKLKWARGKHPSSKILIATESVFSMDGDLAPLLNIVELKERYGAWLMVDEAHATGLFGSHRRGVVEEFDLSDRVEIQMATLGKAVGASGGAICGSRSLIDLLINKARPFIYSTAPTPAAAAVAKAGIQLLAGAEGETRRQRLWAMVDQLKNMFLSIGKPPGLVRAPIIPIICGESDAALAMSEDLFAQGIMVPAIRYPTVRKDEARLRFTITSDHTLEHLAQLEAALTSADPNSEAQPDA
jgi:8-amino-7-oxononanoate synthase